jgi:DNA ligase (NAD+)
MDSERARKRIEELAKLIEHHRFAYYVLDRPEITDAKFDELFEELKSLEAKFPELITPASPTQTVGYKPSTDFKSVRHRIPMLSLSNAMSFEELDRWEERLLKALGYTAAQGKRIKYVCEPKIDGLSIALIYRNGSFIQGATRGNGEVGEDVTPNLRTISELPAKLKSSSKFKLSELLDIRGEVYMAKSSFAALNDTLAESGGALFANPRNAASGSLRQKDPRVTSKRALSLWTYFAYEQPKTHEPDTQSETLALLKSFGLPVNPHSKLVSGLDEVKDYCQYWHDARHNLEYQTDGVVIKFNDRTMWDELGETAHSPRWAIAFKYPPEESETIVESITVDVGRTGAITPVANLKPVKLAGTTVKRASLHNPQQIKKLDVREHDTVIVRKAGEIIPQVVSVNLKHRPRKSTPYHFPTHCPVCHTKLHQTPGEAVPRCPNIYGCPAQGRRRIEHWVSRAAMDIEGMGERLAEQLIEVELIRDPADIYRLTRKDLMSLPHIGEKSAGNLLAAIEESKTRPLSNLINALGIRHVGTTIAELLADEFGSLHDLSNAPKERLDNIDGIGPAISDAIYEYFREPEHRKLINALHRLGLKLEASKQSTRHVSQTLAGKILVLTGTLSMERAEVEKLIKQHGGKTSSLVSKKTDYVVVGESPGSKLTRAQELEITILNEAQFKKLLGI